MIGTDGERKFGKSVRAAWYEDDDTINSRSQCLGQERKNIWRHNVLGDKIIQNCAREIRRKFNLNNHPQKSLIYRWVHKFLATGSVNNFNKKAENSRSDRKLTARCHDNVDAVKDSVRRSLKKSPRRRSEELGFSRGLLNKDNQFLPLSSG